MVRYTVSLAVLAGLLLSMAGVAQAESDYSPVMTMKSSINPTDSATSSYFNQVSSTYMTGGNWNAGIPTSTMNGYIGGNDTGGYTANLNSAATTVGNLLLGANTAGYVGYGTLSMGPGASLTVATAIYLGYQSNGTITVSSNTSTAATLTSGATYIGGASGYSGATGTMSVSGNSAKWTDTGAVYVGYYGPGNMSITSSGNASTAGCYIGGTNVTGINGTGTVTVDGGSKWTSSSILYDGSEGSGTLTISNGSTATFSTASFFRYRLLPHRQRIAVRPQRRRRRQQPHHGNRLHRRLRRCHVGTGTAQVDGAGSKWTIGGASSNLYVGNTGNGTLHITNGGSVINTTGTGQYRRHVRRSRHRCRTARLRRSQRRNVGNQIVLWVAEPNDGHGNNQRQRAGDRRRHGVL